MPDPSPEAPPAGTAAPEAPEGRIRVVSVEDLGDLEAHAEAWDRLGSRCPQGMPTVTHAWAASVLEHRLRPGERWRCLLAYDGPELVGALPVVRTSHRLLGPKRPRLKVPGHANTPDGDLALAPGREAAAIAALLAALDELEPRRFSLELGGVRDRSGTMKALGAPLPKAMQIRAVDVEGAWFRIEGPFAEYWSKVSKNLKGDLRKAANRMQRDGLPEARATFLAGDDAGGDALDRFAALEASGWKGREGTAIASRPEETARYRTMCRRFAARRMLEWHFLEIGGRLAAGHLCVRLGRSLALVKLAYEESLSQYSPGHVLLRHALEREHASGACDDLNFMNVWPWCSRWRMETDWYHRVVLQPRRLLPWVLGVLPARARAVARRIPGLRRLAARLRPPEES
jgi:hypothetical protein